jgi:hypothetical protein
MADFNWDDAKSGAVTGGVAGASAGTMVMPGLGTLAGGAIGAIGGGLIGGYGGFGGGLWDTLSGQVDTSKYFQDPDATNLKMQQNENVLGQWAQTGNGPSAAQNLLARNRSEGQQRALSNAKSMGAGNPALTAQLANRQQSQVSADSALQASTLRAQEQQNAMQAYQQAMQVRRQQSIDQERARLEAEQKNAENNSGFIGSLLSGAGGAMGGMLGG